MLQLLWPFVLRFDTDLLLLVVPFVVDGTVQYILPGFLVTDRDGDRSDSPRCLDYTGNLGGQVIVGIHDSLAQVMHLYSETILLRVTPCIVEEPELEDMGVVLVGADTVERNCLYIRLLASHIIVAAINVGFIRAENLDSGAHLGGFIQVGYFLRVEVLVWWMVY